MQVPFGARIRFLPNRTSRHWKQRKPFESKLIEGISLGWKPFPGGRWSGLYRVAALEDFAELPLLRGLEDCAFVVFSQDTHKIEVPEVWEYPLRERYQYENTLSGRQSVIERMDGEGNIDL